MRVVCASTPEGRVYKFYRVSDEFPRALKRLVPFLMACQVDVVVGSDVHDFELKLRVGPISGESETMLLDLLGSSLSRPCEAAPPGA